MKGEGVGLMDGGTKVGVWVGVRGDESCAEPGEESVSKAGGRGLESALDSFLGATDVTFESTPDPIPESRTRLSSDKPLSMLTFGDLIVLAFECLEFTEIFDLRSSSFPILDVREKKDVCELGLISVSSSSCTCVIRVGVGFRCC
jgi:hypothetical protein